MPAETLRQPTPARVVAAGISALVLTVGIARFAYTPLLPVMRDEAGLGAIVGLMMPHNPARAMARLTLADGLAQIVGPAAAAYIAGPQDHYRGALLIAAAIGLAGTLLSLACCPLRRGAGGSPNALNRSLSPPQRAGR